MISEQFFQYIWQHALFSSGNLQSAEGEKITVVFPGKLNKNAGPDFEEAKIKIGATLWVGNVELHLKAADWLKHGHQHDRAYDNVILHVVWEHEGVFPQVDAPMLVLRDKVSEQVLRNYEALQHRQEVLPCATHIGGVNDLIKNMWLERLLVQRREAKFQEWQNILDHNAGDWRVLLYIQLAQNFGFKTNALPFCLLAKSLPLNILSRHHGNLFSIEAMILGQAGFLHEDLKEDYAFALYQEYSFLQKKYKLQPLPAHIWKFMRMRPANFPTVRMAQFAALVHRSAHLFSQIVADCSLQDLRSMFDVCASEFWDKHFRLDDEPATASKKHLGRQSIDNIIINTVAPIRFFYFKSTAQLSASRMQDLAEQLPPEKNAVIDRFAQINWLPENAAQSQAMLELHKYFCAEKRCLQCSVGNKIIRSSPIE